MAAASTVLPPAVRESMAAGADLLELVLGEGQFGPDHWRLSRARRLYYLLKPALPRALISLLRRVHAAHQPTASKLEWPVEARYVGFLAETGRRLLVEMGADSLPFIDFWPHGHRFALVLTHDIETAAGQSYAARVADLEEKLGFRSSFNFVGERYPLDLGLIADLRRRGFEIGLHGLKHDGKLFRSRAEFQRRAQRMNALMRELGAVGFRSPLTLRHPGWMQDLEIEYDLSFFDTDPYEPLPGGTMSVWPFQVGSFLELPYTLAQDHTLTSVLGQRSPRLWLDKVDFIASCRGMALLNTHPDYLLRPATLSLYRAFLLEMQGRDDHWTALPREVARWWSARSSADSPASLTGAVEARMTECDPFASRHRP